MGRLGTEPYEEFLESLKRAGIEIVKEHEVRERLGEVRRWRDAFTTLARNGRALGILFKSRDSGLDQAEIHRTFTQFQFPEQSEVLFEASLKANC